LNSPPQSLPDMSKRPAAKVQAQNSFRLKPAEATPANTICRRQRNNDTANESQVELRRPCGNAELVAVDKDSKSPQTPPPPPPPTSASTALNSRTSRASSGTPQQYRAHSHTEEETMSNHSESTELTGVSGTMTNSEFGGTIDKKFLACKTDQKADKTTQEKFKKDKDILKSDLTEAQQTAKKLKDEDFGAIFNTHINGLRMIIVLINI
ncbi:hypothetical protein EVAR_73096_1, partial [Eumeta japonica]